MDLAALQKITQDYMVDLEHAKNGEPSTLAYIRNTISASPIVQDGETFQVMVVGGTNFFSARIKKVSGNVEILDEQHKEIPTFDTAERFLSFVLENLAESVTTLAINFGLALEPVFVDGKLQGIFLPTSPAKEHKFTGMIGKNICQEIEKYVKEKTGRSLGVAIANDTICLLLSGKTKVTGDNLAAGIVGTGINFAFFDDATTLINTETGAFGNFQTSAETQEIDATSAHKNIHLYEKEVAGGYLFMHFNLLAKKRNIEAPSLATSKEVSDQASKEDNSPASLLAKEVLMTSAEYAACTFAGISMYKKKSFVFVMQGSLFWKGYQYKERVTETFKKLAPDYTIEYIQVEHADLLGAAKLVA